MAECRAETEKSQDADYILACMRAAGYMPLDWSLVVLASQQMP